MACPRGELRRDVVQMRQFNCMCVELAALVSVGHLLPGGASAAGRPIRRRLAELRTFVTPSVTAAVGATLRRATGVQGYD